MMLFAFPGGGPLRRFARLLRRTPLRQKSPIRPVNPERVARRQLLQYGPRSYRAWLLAHGCTTCPRPASDMAHVVSRGAGGDWRKCIPMCRKCHDLQHRKGWKALADKTGWGYALLLVEAHQFAEEFARTHPGTMEKFLEELARA